MHSSEQKLTDINYCFCQGNWCCIKSQKIVSTLYFYLCCAFMLHFLLKQIICLILLFSLWTKLMCISSLKYLFGIDSSKRVNLKAYKSESKVKTKEDEWKGEMMDIRNSSFHHDLYFRLRIQLYISNVTCTKEICNVTG